SRAQVDAYKIAREYMDVAIAAVRPGATTADIVKLWPKAQEFGFPDEEAAFALQYGHGVGLSIWEKPIFSRLTSLEHPEVLEEGMVFALETYWPAADGWGAARIEEEVVVTKDGCEVITKFPAEDLLVAGGGRYFTVNGPLPGIRDSQSHLNTPEGRGEVGRCGRGRTAGGARAVPCPRLPAAIPDLLVVPRPDHHPAARPGDRRRPRLDARRGGHGRHGARSCVLDPAARVGAVVDPVGPTGGAVGLDRDRCGRERRDRSRAVDDDLHPCAHRLGRGVRGGLRGRAHLLR